MKNLAVVSSLFFFFKESKKTITELVSQHFQALINSCFIYSFNQTFKIIEVFLNDVETRLMRY